jgi:hypothetical protein
MVVFTRTQYHHLTSTLPHNWLRTPLNGLYISPVTLSSWILSEENVASGCTKDTCIDGAGRGVASLKNC